MAEQTATWPPRWTGSNFKHESVTPRVLEKSRKESEHDRKLAKAYAAVDAREDNVCQVSGVKLSPASRDAKRLREHHHIKGRNVKPEWVYEPKRILLVSKFIHDLFTGKALVLDGTDATAKPLKLRWNRAMVKPGKEPMRLATVGD